MEDGCWKMEDGRIYSSGEIARGRAGAKPDANVERPSGKMRVACATRGVGKEKSRSSSRKKARSEEDGDFGTGDGEGDGDGGGGGGGARLDRQLARR